MEAVQELTDVIREQGAAGAGGSNDSGSIGSSRELEVIDMLDSLGGSVRPVNILIDAPGLLHRQRPDNCRDQVEFGTS